MTEIIGVRFKRVGKIYYFDPVGLKFEKGQFAVVETARGIELGETAIPNKMVVDDSVVSPLKPVLRMAATEDINQFHENEKKEKEAFDICAQKIEDHNLEMKLVDVEYTFDGNKILFYFTSDGRVDFRELVKDLASIFRTRIELRQIGVRDEAKMKGGLGICGKPFCCSSFLGEFQPVSIKMAKEQSLSLNPVKISGTCGRLMCCLKYEQEAYEDLLAITPEPGTRVKTPDYTGEVTEVNLLRGILKVKPENGGNGDIVPRSYHLGQLEVIKKVNSLKKKEEVEDTALEETLLEILDDEKPERKEEPPGLPDRQEENNPSNRQKQRNRRKGRNKNKSIQKPPYPQDADTKEKQS